MLSTDVLTVSWLYKDGVKAGRAEGKVEGKVEGKAEGKTEGKRESFRLALSAKFPDLGPLPEIDGIDCPETLDQLLLAVVNAKTGDDVRTAVQSAVRVN
jgi:hypothetical protein